MNQNLLRNIPKVDDVLRMPSLAQLCSGIPHSDLVEAVRTTIGELRQQVLEGELAELPTLSNLCETIALKAQRLHRPSLRPVLNGTGVTLHTNLGRACLGQRAAEAAAEAARNYSTLEYDVEAGGRGHRYAHVESLLVKLTGAEAAFVVNNNAAAVLLMLSALTQGGEVICSRGELVEIGGAFRVPDIMESCGAVLKEVGTTNKTNIRDYERAVNEKTRALMKVHTSNYRIVGFTDHVERKDMTELGHRLGLPVFEDMGGGSLMDLNPLGVHDEPTVQECVAAGMDVVTFSGDKLLGGPQAGILVGKKEYIDICRKHPLARAMRVDKMTLAALEATLRSFAEGKAVEEVPTMEMLFRPVSRLKNQAEELCTRLKEQGVPCEVLEVEDQVGGGSVPMQLLPGYAVAIAPETVTVEALERALRLGEPPIIGRVDHGKYLLHVRTFFEEDYDTIAQRAGKAVK